MRITLKEEKLRLEDLQRVDAIRGVVSEPLKLTFKELALSLKELVDFKYLTCHKETYSIYATVRLHWDRPCYYEPFWISGNEDCEMAGELLIKPSKLDFSEYKNENGEIDYSKCIVEVV